MDVVFCRPPGFGEAHLATSLAVAAIAHGRSVNYTMLVEVINALRQAQANGTFKRRMALLLRLANYVKSFVKRQNDANDAAAVVEAANRASMRYVAVKTRVLFVQQRTQTANAIRSHLQEFGIVCGRGLLR